MLAARCARLLAARRALSTEVVAPKFDFSELASFVSSDEAKREVAALKKTVEDIGNTLEAQAKPTPPIDFDHFRKTLTGAPGLVDTFEKAYKGLKLPQYDSAEGEQMKALFAKVDAATTDAAAHATRRIKALEAELVALGKEKEQLRTLTVDEVLASSPALATSLSAEIEAGEWYGKPAPAAEPGHH